MTKFISGAFMSLTSLWGGAFLMHDNWFAWFGFPLFFTSFVLFIAGFVLMAIGADEQRREQ